MLTLTTKDFEAARARIAPHIHWTPLLTSHQLSDLTGFDVRLKAECFQKVGSYKIRGPLNKFAQMPEEEKRRGVVCSSAGNHAQGVALAARIHGIRAVVCMATNATPAKVAATKAYGAEVVSHGTIWDEANEKAKKAESPGTAPARSQTFFQLSTTHCQLPGSSIQISGLPLVPLVWW